MNDGEIGLIVLLASIVSLILFFVNVSLRKHKALFIIPAIGIIVSGIFFWKFATTTTVANNSAVNGNAQPASCAPDKIACND